MTARVESSAWVGPAGSGQSAQARARPLPAVECYSLFDTALGACGIAWSGVGLTRLQLPHQDRAATEARLRRGRAEAAGSLPRTIAEAIAELERYFAGEPVDLGSIALDLESASAFHRCVYEATRAIGYGRTKTYGELAAKVGAPGAARAIGQAMGANPIPIIIPCHRVLAAGGKVGGFSAYGGAATKERLLALEGVRLGPELPLLALLDGRAARG